MSEGKKEEFKRGDELKTEGRDEEPEEMALNDSCCDGLNRSSGKINKIQDQTAAATTAAAAAATTATTTADDEDDDDEDKDVYELPDLYNLIIQRYEGDTCDGQFDGEGVACFEGGHVYKGTFSSGLMDGLGVFTWAGKVKYEGEFVCNMPQGHGSYTWSDGSFYKGHVHHGLRHGTGTFTCPRTGVSYTGQWHQSQRHGQGDVFYNQEKTSWYKGEWVKNSREGWGERCYPSGNTYCGEWKNNLRNGAGTMKWLKQRQQYEGQWLDGVQHGLGTHTWILRRTNGFQFCESNRFTGDFIGGQRHGRGCFYYTSGAIYEGEWRNNKKHGQGRFTFQDGRVVEGEFVDDQMTTPNLRGNAVTPDSSRLGPDMSLNIHRLLEQLPERRRDAELQQVEFVVLRHHKELKSIYSFYSRLGLSDPAESLVLLSQLQLWRLLKDCNLHHHQVTLTQLDLYITDDSAAEVHSPFTPMLLRRFLSCLVIISFHIYHQDLGSQKYLLASCFSKILTDDILPNAKTVKGFLFQQPDCSRTLTEKYLKKCWEIYECQCRVSAMSWQQLLWMFKELDLLDEKLTSARLLKVITAESRDPSDLSSYLLLQISFLEFVEVLLGCAEVKCGQVPPPNDDEDGGDKRSSTNTEEEEEEEATRSNNKPDVQHVEEQQSQPAGQTRGSEVKHQRLQLFHHFFIHVFFPAFDHHQLVSSNMEEEKVQGTTREATLAV